MINKETLKYLPQYIKLRKTELGFAIFGLCTLLMGVTISTFNPIYVNNQKELLQSQEMNRQLSSELRKYYLLEQDLVEAGASYSQARDIIKAADLLEDSNLARDLRGK